MPIIGFAYLAVRASRHGRAALAAERPVVEHDAHHRGTKSQLARNSKIKEPSQSPSRKNVTTCHDSLACSFPRPAKETKQSERGEGGRGTKRQQAAGAQRHDGESGDSPVVPLFRHSGCDTGQKKMSGQFFFLAHLNQPVCCPCVALLWPTKTQSPSPERSERACVFLFLPGPVWFARHRPLCSATYSKDRANKRNHGRIETRPAQVDQRAAQAQLHQDRGDGHWCGLHADL